MRGLRPEVAVPDTQAIRQKLQREEMGRAFLDSLSGPCEDSSRGIPLGFRPVRNPAMIETVQPATIRLEAASHCQLRWYC